MYQFVLAYAYTYLYLYAYIKEHYLERPFMFFLHLKRKVIGAMHHSESIRHIMFSTAHWTYSLRYVQFAIQLFTRRWRYKGTKITAHPKTIEIWCWCISRWTTSVRNQAPRPTQPEPAQAEWVFGVSWESKQAYRVIHHIAWSHSVRWCLAVGLVCGDRRRLTRSGSALGVLHDDALYKSTYFTFLLG